MSVPVHVLGVVGARPNFMKMAPVLGEMDRSSGFRSTLVHTGQHYDPALSEAFFRDLELPAPDVHLGVGSADHASQTARILSAFEPVLCQADPDLVLVAGDVNSTLACALCAVKLGYPVGHVESGLRSYDRTMPEEINRVLTDHISDLLFTHSADAGENLIREGRPRDQIHFVGNTMIDTLRRFEARARQMEAPGNRGLSPGAYALVTLHRPSNVDQPSDQERVLRLLQSLSELLPVVFPVHPRTRARLESTERWNRLVGIPGLEILDPLGYLEFLGLMTEARVVVTDSGGIQEETTALGVPCLTLRPNTERPITVEQGTNLMVSTEPDRHLETVRALLHGQTDVRGRLPELWDGAAGVRLVRVLESWAAKSPGGTEDPGPIHPRSS